MEPRLASAVSLFDPVFNATRHRYYNFYSPYLLNLVIWRVRVRGLPVPHTAPWAGFLVKVQPSAVPPEAVVQLCAVVSTFAFLKTFLSFFCTHS